MLKVMFPKDMHAAVKKKKYGEYCRLAESIWNIIP